MPSLEWGEERRKSAHLVVNYTLALHFSLCLLPFLLFWPRIDSPLSLWELILLSLFFNITNSPLSFIVRIDFPLVHLILLDRFPVCFNWTGFCSESTEPVFGPLQLNRFSVHFNWIGCRSGSIELVFDLIKVIFRSASGKRVFSSVQLNLFSIWFIRTCFQIGQVELVFSLVHANCYTIWINRVDLGFILIEPVFGSI